LADALVEKFGGDSIAELDRALEAWSSSMAGRFQAPAPR
jgi:hypothetical protein